MPRTTEGQLRLEIINLWLCQLGAVCHFLHSTQQPDYRTVGDSRLNCLQKGARELGEKKRAQVPGGFNDIKNNNSEGEGLGQLEGQI